MLQQTQVITVIPYFNRFVERFADLESLAAANDDEVLALWSGLGYYARARNLLKTAKICLEDHGGELPRTPDKLAALPGIGESTANAIFSQAYNKPAVVLDGNVKRVMARYLRIEGWPGKAGVHKLLWRKAGQLLPAKRGADYTQAIMDLGATLCRRTEPECGKCPVRDDCKAFASGTVEQYPAKRPRLKIASKSFQMLILTDKKGNVLLERRPPAGVWGGLWSLPSDDNGEPLQQRLGLDQNTWQSLPTIKHQLTHISMTIHPFIGHTEMIPGGVECAPDRRWFEHQAWQALGLPKPVRQLLEIHLESAGK